jgi:branched-chain amino acid aminotransferase/4-amino-4-deoxychorismate lyase
MDLILNGQILREEDFHLSTENRAFTYGDGIFETLIAKEGNIKFFKEHLERLKAGLKVLDIVNEKLFDEEELQKKIISLIKINGIRGIARIKIMVWRKSGGLFSPEKNEGEYLILIKEHIKPAQQKEKVFFYKENTKTYSAVSKFKTISSLHYVLAGIFKNKNAADDLILFDSKGNISECLNSNIFWIKDHFVFTPSLLSACVDGIMRKQIIQKLKEKKIILIEGEFSSREIMHADFVFTSNVTGLFPVLSVEGKTYNAKNGIFQCLSSELNYC